MNRRTSLKAIAASIAGIVAAPFTVFAKPKQTQKISLPPLILNANVDKYRDGLKKAQAKIMETFRPAIITPKRTISHDGRWEYECQFVRRVGDSFEPTGESVLAYNTSEGGHDLYELEEGLFVQPVGAGVKLIALVFKVKTESGPRYAFNYENAYSSVRPPVYYG